MDILQTKFGEVKIEDSEKINRIDDNSNPNSITLGYPCKNRHVCVPYEVSLKPGTYEIECWGSAGSYWISNNSLPNSTPGLGGYTYGKIVLRKPTKFYIYIGNTGFFNAVKNFTTDANSAQLPGGATDVRLTKTEEWSNLKSLITRIMVAGGGGGAEWSGSIGGNGGGLNGTSSISGADPNNALQHNEPCPGGTQTNGSKCIHYRYEGNYHHYGEPVSGTFGSGGVTIPYYGKYENGTIQYEDYGGFGGGGYYGGTSYSIAFAGSGGSSYISGHDGCDSVKNNTEFIEHTGDPNHFLGYVFYNTTMISGNTTMPLPGKSELGIHSGAGAFRVTLLSLTKITRLISNIRLVHIMIYSASIPIVFSRPIET